LTKLDLSLILSISNYKKLDKKIKIELLWLLGLIKSENELKTKIKKIAIVLEQNTLNEILRIKPKN